MSVASFGCCSCALGERKSCGDEGAPGVLGAAAGGGGAGATKDERPPAPVAVTGAGAGVGVVGDCDSPLDVTGRKCIMAFEFLNIVRSIH